MSISYKGLWEQLKAKNMRKKDLAENLNISSATLAKMGKGESVSMDVMARICDYLGCDIGDVMSFENCTKTEEESR